MAYLEYTICSQFFKTTTTIGVIISIMLILHPRTSWWIFQNKQSQKAKNWFQINQKLFSHNNAKKCCSITAIPLMICKSLSIQKPGHDCWSGEANYNCGSIFASRSWRKQVSRTWVGGSKQGSWIKQVCCLKFNNIVAKKTGTVEDWKHRCILYMKYILGRNKKKINTQSRTDNSHHHPFWYSNWN